MLPQGATFPATPLGGVYDTQTGAKVADVANFRWNAERPDNSVHIRFFDYYGAANQVYSTYFYQPELRQVSTATVLGPDAATTLYRYDSLGRLRMTIDPTGRRNYMMYDHSGRKIADIDSDGSVIEYRYDGNDNLISTTRYVNKMSIGRPPLGRPLGQSDRGQLQPASPGRPCRRPVDLPGLRLRPAPDPDDRRHRRDQRVQL